MTPDGHYPTRTIVAVATAPGHAGVGVVRVSGPLARQIAIGILGREPQPREAAFMAFRDAAGDVIDRRELLGGDERVGESRVRGGEHADACGRGE